MITILQTKRMRLREFTHWKLIAVRLRSRRVGADA